MAIKNYADKVAVITGGASGIGHALAQACVAEGMRVVIADLPGARLDAAERQLKDLGGAVLAVACDVGKLADVQALAERTMAEFGAVHLLCNNAGISARQRWLWNYSADNWNHILTVNLMGVLHGLQVFVPLMLDIDEGHIVNTASTAGLMPTPMNAPYTASKFGVVGASEALCLDLRKYGSSLGVSVLCPGLINTAIGSEDLAAAGMDPAEQAYNRRVGEGMTVAMSPQVVAELVLAGVRKDTFYLLTHPEVMPMLEQRAAGITSGEAGFLRGWQ